MFSNATFQNRKNTTYQSRTTSLHQIISHCSAHCISTYLNSGREKTCNCCKNTCNCCNVPDEGEVVHEVQEEYQFEHFCTAPGTPRIARLSPFVVCFNWFRSTSRLYSKCLIKRTGVGLNRSISLKQLQNSKQKQKTN